MVLKSASALYRPAAVFSQCEKLCFRTCCSRARTWHVHLRVPYASRLIQDYIAYVSVTRRAKSQNLIVETFGLSLRLIICSPTHRIALRSRVQQRSSVRYVCAGCLFTTGPDFIFCRSMLELLRSVVRPSCRSHGLFEDLPA